MSEKPETCVEAWAAAVERLAAQDNDVVVLVNDSIGSAGLRSFVDRFPDRIVNVGIAEQNLVSVAAGLAASGKTVFASSAASFLTGRALEQIKVDVAYGGASVKLIGQSPGVSYGALGVTHHAIEDLAWMIALPGISIVAPSHPEETASAIGWAASWPGSVYVRVPRRLYGAAFAPFPFEFGKARVLQDGHDVTIVATGATVGLAVAASAALIKERIEARVLCMSTVKPLDERALLDAANSTSGLVTVEDGVVAGLGASVAGFLAERTPVQVKRVGFDDEFARPAPDSIALHHAGVTTDAIVSAARDVCATDRRGEAWRLRPSET